MGDKRREFQHPKYKGHFQGRSGFKSGPGQNSKSRSYQQNSSVQRKWNQFETTCEKKTEFESSHKKSHGNSGKRNQMQENLIKLSETEPTDLNSKSSNDDQAVLGADRRDRQHPTNKSSRKLLQNSATVQGSASVFQTSGKNIVFEDEEGDEDMPVDVSSKDERSNHEGENSDGESENEYAEIKKELSNISFEDLQKLKDSLGLKKFNSIVHGKSDAPNKKKMVFKRENSNRPREMSSKVPVPVLGPTDVPKKKVGRDPRFDDLSGEFSEFYFNRDYSFLSEMKSKEKEKVKKKMRKEKNTEKRAKLKSLLTKMEQEEEKNRQKEKREQLDRQLKQKEREMVKEGKMPYFLKKSERRKLELAEKFKELKKTGKMDKYLVRRRKKNAQKERKKIKFS